MGCRRAFSSDRGWRGSVLSGNLHVRRRPFGPRADLSGEGCISRLKPFPSAPKFPAARANALRPRAFVRVVHLFTPRKGQNAMASFNRSTAATVLFAFVTFAAITLFPTNARAARTFDYVTDNNNGTYTVAPNASVSVHVFIRETLSAGSTSLLVPEDGLFSDSAAIATNSNSESAAPRMKALRHIT